MAPRTSSDGNEFYLVSFPKGTNEELTYHTIKKKIASQENPYSDVFHFDVPTMRVGTLEKLMSAGDSLGKVDAIGENTIRKIERQYNEVNMNNEPLTVDGISPIQYVQEFRWSAAKYQSQRPIEEIMKQITNKTHKIESELKEAASIYQEKKTILTQTQRKQGGNLMTVELESVLTDNLVNADMFTETEYLTTIVIIVPKQQESQFKFSYESLANDAVGYGPEENRQAILGSPVVPRSAIKVTEDREGYCLYLITILRNYLDAVKLDAQSNRYLVRDYQYRPGASTESFDTLATMESEFEQAKNQLTRWCKTHYGEAFIAWMHTKAIRIFVESVLRYGLPVSFLPMLVKPRNKKGDKILKILDRVYEDITGSSVDSDTSVSMADSSSNAMTGLLGMTDDYHGYICYSFTPEAAEQ